MEHPYSICLFWGPLEYFYVMKQSDLKFLNICYCLNTGKNPNQKVYFCICSLFKRLYLSLSSTFPVLTSEKQEQCVPFSINPRLCLIITKCFCVHRKTKLLFFNQREEDILWRCQLDALAASDERYRSCVFVFEQPDLQI